ncbi:MAG: hypothetical protein Q9226_004789 [Calogaya cf. arnoldii]
MYGHSAAWLFIFLFRTLAFNIEDSFEVRDSCTVDQRRLLDQFVTETLELVHTALKDFDDFNNGIDEDKIMEQNLLMYFKAKKTPANKIVDRIENMLHDVKELLEGRGTAYGGGGKPRLYCSSKLWQQKQPGDIAQNPNGDPIPEKTIRDLYGQELGVVDGKQRYAYWSDDYNTYSFGDDTQDEFYCDNENNLAVTDDTDPIRPIYTILCPSSFKIQPGTNPPNPPRTTVLGDTRPQDGQSLDNLQPRSLTFFHEVIHVVRGSIATTRTPKRPAEWCKLTRNERALLTSKLNMPQMVATKSWVMPEMIQWDPERIRTTMSFSRSATGFGRSESTPTTTIREI